MSGFESVVEEAAIEYFRALGYAHVSGPDIAPDGPYAERKSYYDVVLEGRLRAALVRINPHLGADTLDEVAGRVTRQHTTSVEERNVEFQAQLQRGVGVQVRRNGEVRGDQAWLVDRARPEQNDWLVVSQFTVAGGKGNRRPDLVVFLNGLPVAVVELKNPSNEKATLKSAWNQLQTYKSQVPALFAHNEVLVISDGTEAQCGSLTAGFERFGPWRTIEGEAVAADATPKLEVLLKGMFEKRRFLDYIHHFVLWETEDGFVKKIAAYHQYHAVNKAIEQTVRASIPSGDKRIGVVWHTQGSGKSISMLFYAGKLVTHPQMHNPTVVVITDRNDLDGQLFAQFATAKGLLPAPVQAESREHLKELLQVASGGVVFTTIQKFGVEVGERYPMLSERRNVVVIADEAHRSQYAFVEGFARNLRDGLPGASFIGFTGTPIDFSDKSTLAVFGDYLDTYTISQAVQDQATVPLYYEARLAMIALPEERKPSVDTDFDEVTEGEEELLKGELKTRWARLEAMVGTQERLELIAKDIVTHFERRTEILEGKAMIVAMSRRIAVDLYDAIVALKPEWDNQDDAKGGIKVVMTGNASDPLTFQRHVRNKAHLKAIEKRFKDPSDPLQMVIVRDMWLTGFDAPCVHTLYVDKPMKGHGLMQAIARVNRVFKDKPSGLVVDYLGLAEQLRQAIGTYDGQGGERPGIPIEVALNVLLERFGIVKDMFHGFDYSGYFSTTASARLAALSGGADKICGLQEGKKRFLDAMVALNKAAGIAIHLEGARHLRDEVGYFQALQKNLNKYTLGDSGKSNDELDAAIRQIVSSAVSSEQVIDIFGQAGLKRPDISILSEEFLEALQQSPHQNLQLELLKKLISDQIKSLSRRNLVQSRKFSEMLERTLQAYQNRTLEAAQVIVEMIDMAREMRQAPGRGATLGLTEDEMAFYDALIDHATVKDLMSNDALAIIAQNLVETIRASVTLDWTQKESVRADMRRNVKHLLHKHGYPPAHQAEAMATILEQAEVVCRDWADTPPHTQEQEEDLASLGNADSHPDIAPFVKLPTEEVEPFVNALPLYDLRVAAGRFSGTQIVQEAAQRGEIAYPDRYTWATYQGRSRPARGLFIAQVVGESMNKRIPNGAWAVWRLNPTGSRQGKIVLVEHRDIQDQEMGGRYTVKLYESRKEHLDDGTWRHVQITLKPMSTDPTFLPIVLHQSDECELRVIAELVEVL